MGVFEIPPFDAATWAIADAIARATDARRDGQSSAAATLRGRRAVRRDWRSECRTSRPGGGASLEFLEGKTFAPLDVLDDALTRAITTELERKGRRIGH